MYKRKSIRIPAESIIVGYYGGTKLGMRGFRVHGNVQVRYIIEGPVKGTVKGREWMS